MGIKNIFKRKEPSEAELVNDLNKLGITTRGPNQRQDKFGAFQQYAQEQLLRKPGFAPVNPYANVDAVQGNPYAEGNTGNAAVGGASSGNAGRSPYGTSASASPYGAAAGGRGNPYGASPNASAPSPYTSSNASTASTGAAAPYGASSTGGARTSSTGGATSSTAAAYNPYGRTTSRAGYELSISTRADDEESVIDLNRIPSRQIGTTKPARRPNYDNEELDLNALPEEDDLNLDYNEELPQEQEVNSEDEEVEAIRQDIRFVKQESVASTRNTLRMAQEADALGTNTMGMLGSQSERLFNAEQNLLLADTQTEIADSKIKELNRLNRSIFIPAAGNPFNKKSRLRQQEESIKNAKSQEKYMRETNRQEMYASEQRIKSGITNTATDNETHNKYRDERSLAAAQRYQFENDSEDDDMEKELSTNLDQIGLYAKKLKQSAHTIGEEVDQQNTRLRKIEEDADRLDINVHMNNTRLQNIR